ncbi:MAG: PKD domain-containing protein [Bacteroidota bacterium]
MNSGNRVSSVGDQCPSISQTGSAAGVSGQTLNFSASTTAGTVNWDFCEGDLAGLPTLKSSPLTFSGAGQMTIVSDTIAGQILYYGFMPYSDASNNLSRFDFGTDLTGNPRESLLGNPGGLMSGNSVALRFMKEAGIWYALAIQNTSNTIIRLRFGAGIGSSPTSAQTLTLPAGTLNRPLGLDVARDGDSVYAFITNNNTNVLNNFVRLRFGTSISNAPVSEFLNDSVMSGNFSNIGSLTLIRDCCAWHALIVAANGQLFSMNFGASLGSRITSRSVNSYALNDFFSTTPNAVLSVTGIAAGLDSGRWNVFICTSTAPSIISRISFANGINSPPTAAGAYSFYGGLSNLLAITLYHKNSDWFAFTADRSAGTKARHILRFPDLCNASPAYASGSNVSVTYQHGGVFGVGASVVNTGGCKAVSVKSVSVSAGSPLSAICPAPVLNIPASVCINSDFTVSATGTNITQYDWDLCSGDFTRNPTLLNIAGTVTQQSVFNHEPFADGDNFYAIQTGIEGGVSKVLTFSYGNDLKNFPLLAGDWGNPNNSIGNATDIKTIKDKGIWYALAVNSQQNVISTLSLLSFTNGLESQPTGNLIAANGVFSGASSKGLEIIRDNGKIYALVTTGGAQVAVFSFGNSMLNTPVVRLIKTNKAFTKVSAKRECNIWTAYFVENAGTVSRFSFLNGLDAQPEIFQLTLPATPALGVPANIKLVNDADQWYALILNSAGNLMKLGIGNSLRSTSGFSVTQFTLPAGASSNNTTSFNIQKQGTEWIAFMVNASAGTLNRILFSSPCTARPQSFKGDINNTVNYTSNGNFPVYVTATDTGGNVSVTTGIIRIKAPVTPGFRFSGNYCHNSIITFTDTSQPAVAGTTWTTEWNFGDVADTATAQARGTQVTYSYARPGTYLVRMILHESGGCIIKSQAVSVRIAALPEPDFNIPALACGNDSAMFTFTGNPGTDVITAYRWTLSDGRTSAAINPKFYFSDPGSYTASLKLSGQSGCDTTLVQGFTVSPGIRARFTAVNKCFGEQVLFTDNSEYQPGATPTIYRWDFGDNTATSSDPSETRHTYANPGLYFPTLNITNSAGCRSVVRDSLRIYPLPRITLARQFIALAGDSVSFRELSTSPFSQITGRTWHFGGPDADSSDNRQNAFHLYADPGVYTVGLTVTNSQGCRKDTSFNIIILSKCISFGASLSSRNVGTNTEVTAEPTGGNISNTYEYDFCAGDLMGIPTLATKNFTAVNPTGIGFVQEAGKVYGFMMHDNATAPSYRIGFDNGGLNPDIITGFPPVTFQNIVLPQAIKFVQLNGRKYAFVMNIINASSGICSIIRYDFANSYGDTPSFGAELKNTLMVKPLAMDVVVSGDSLFAFVACNSTNPQGKLLRLKFGTSAESTPAFSSVSDSAFNSGQISNISFITECSKRYAMLASSTGQVWLADFGVSPGFKPEIRQIDGDIELKMGENASFNGVVSLNLLREAGGIYAMMHNNLGQLVRIQYAHGFEGGITSAQNLTNNGINSGAGGPLGMQFFKHQSRWFGFSPEKGADKRLFRWKFPNICSASVPAVNTTGNTPVNNSWSEPGVYYVTLTGTDTSGSVTQLLDSVVVGEGGGVPACTVVPVVNTSGNSGVCVGETVPVSAELPLQSRASWRWCTGGLATDTAKITSVSGILLPGKTGLDIIRDSFGNYLAFSFQSGVANSGLQVLNFTKTAEGDISSTPQTSAPAGFSVDYPQAIKVFKANGNWYGLVLSSNLQSLNYATLIKFRGELPTATPGENPTPPEMSVIGLGNYMQNPKSLEVINDNGHFYAFIANNGNAAVTVLDFGSSPENVPMVHSILIPNASSLKGIGILKECNTWAGILAQENGHLIKMVFRKGLAEQPEITSSPDSIVSLTGVQAMRLVQDGDKYYVFVTTFPGTQPIDNRIKRISLGTSIINTAFSKPTNMNVKGNVFQNINSFTLLPLNDGKWSLLGSQVNPQVIFRADFMPKNNCKVSRDTSAGPAPVNITFTSAGWQKYSFTLTDSLGNVYVHQDSVLVRDPVNAAAIFSGNRCSGQSISFRDISRYNVATGVINRRWNFGESGNPDDVQGNNETESHTYTRPGDYQVILRVSEGATGGCSSADTIRLHIFQRPLPDFTMPDRNSSCTFDSLQFFSNITENGDTTRKWFWTISTLNPDTPIDTSFARDPKFVFPEGNTDYKVRVVFTGTSGCETSAEKFFHPGKLGLRPTFTWALGTNCENDTVKFSATTLAASGVTVTSWNWNFNGTSFGSGQRQNVVLGRNGDYPVTLQIVSSSGCTSSVTQMVHVGRKPGPSIVVPAQVCANAPSEFNYTTTADGQITGQRWDFGDKETSAARRPLHAFKKAGTYIVTVYVTDVAGCTGFVTKTVQVNTSPKANFTYSSVCPGDPVTFTDASQGDSAGNGIQSWFWDFGNSGSSSNQNGNTVTFPSDSDRVHVALTVRGAGCPNTVVKEVVFRPRIMVLPKVAVGCLGHASLFIDSSTIGGIYSRSGKRRWIINNQTDTNASVSVVLAPGTYSYRLERFSNEGCSSFSTNSFSILSPPKASFSLGPDSVITAKPFTISPQNTSQFATTWHWNFGDSTTSNLQNPVHTYKREGTYYVTLIVSNGGACIDSVRHSVNIIDVPRPDAAITKVNATLTGGSLSLMAELYNPGNIEIKSLDLNVEINGLYSFTERWTGSLLPRTPQKYTFRSYVADTNNLRVNTVCVNALMPAGTGPDADLLNNRLCAAISDKFVVLDVYPVPSHEQNIVLSYSLPAGGATDVSVIDAMGRRIFTAWKGTETAGLKELILAKNILPPGFYYIMFQYEGQIQSRKIIVK